MTGRTPRSLLVLLALALAAGCSGSSTAGPDGTSSPSAPATTSSAPQVDTFTALRPPAVQSIGTVDQALVVRAYEASRGLLALSLGEAGTLTGSDTASLVQSLQVPDEALSVKALLTPRPTRKALGLRPLFARTVTLDERPAEIVRSSYRGEEVRGLGGEVGLRVTWDGAVRYRVLVGGQPREVAYALTVAYVFGPVADEPNGLRLVQVVPGTFHAAPVLASCLAQGVLLPGTGSPTPADYGTGPWAAVPAGPACPL